MAAPVVRRPQDAAAIAEFLATASAEPAALVVEGEPGIGKTTLWMDAVEQARERGFRVLSARPAEAESVLAYASLADLLLGVEAAAWPDLPGPQRLAMDRVLLRADADDLPTDQRAVGAGFLSVVAALSDQTPLLLAIDDLQWLEPSTVHVVAFVARRLSARVGVLATVRTDPGGGSASNWLQLPAPDRIRRIQLRPLRTAALHTVLSERLGRSFARPTMARIQQVSGGNPFYALELARALDDETTNAEVPLPSSLTQLVRARIGGLDPDVQQVLLAAACLAAPTVELVARAIRTDRERTVDLVEDAEGKGIIAIDGNRLRFTHPLLARGVYTDAMAARRRTIHRRLAEIVEEPELKARHLALAATHGDAKTLASLDTAAEMARVRGAPAAAAELLDLAVGLGGDTPERRIRLAGDHFDAGDPGRARTLLETTIDRLAPCPTRAHALSLLGLVRLYGDGFAEAAGLLSRAVGEAQDDLALRVQMLVTLAFAQVNAGQITAALSSVEVAVSEASRLGQPHLLSHALGMRVMLHFMHGDGVDAAGLRRALELEDRNADIPLAFRPSVQAALLSIYTGHLERAHEDMLAIRQRCIEEGEEGDLIFVAFNSVLFEIWRGNLAAAALFAEDAFERAVQLDGDFPMFVALTGRAAVASYAGRVDEVRSDIDAALATRQRGRSFIMAWPLTVLGFLEVSLGNYGDALTTLEPLMAKLEGAPNSTEIISASFVPDAVEALIHVGRIAEAEPLIDLLERNGQRLDRAWMLAVGARCRSMLLAAQGNIDAAIVAVQGAMTEHARLPMPFELARTQLLLGQLQRRQRQKDAAARTLRDALSTFEDLDTPLWADRARVELARANVRRRPAVLSPSERRVAELAASGMTNRGVAAALFISPKTVEANLARVYRKLGIHSRAELGRHMGNRSEK